MLNRLTNIEYADSRKVSVRYNTAGNPESIVERKLGIFIRRDPSSARLSEGPYVYGLSNPLRFADPSGYSSYSLKEIEAFNKLWSLSKPVVKMTAAGNKALQTYPEDPVKGHGGPNDSYGGKITENWGTGTLYMWLNDKLLKNKQGMATAFVHEAEHVKQYNKLALEKTGCDEFFTITKATQLNWEHEAFEAQYEHYIELWPTVHTGDCSKTIEDENSKFGKSPVSSRFQTFEKELIRWRVLYLNLKGATVAKQKFDDKIDTFYRHYSDYDVKKLHSFTKFGIKLPTY